MKSAQFSKPHYDEKGYDVIVHKPDIGLFGVFDGMGTSKGARRASKLAAGILESHITTRIADWRAIAYAFQHFNDVARRDPSVGGTTGVAISVNPNGMLHYASVGDSRLYILRGGRVEQITSDEGVENMLLNYLGHGSLGVAQAGYIEPEHWRRALLVSDGITGDREPDLLRIEDIESAMRATSLDMVCEVLNGLATKPDDRSIVVVEQ